ncbi:discoidin domain-containing protein [Demequina soli]|uniref:discoidin domain-containing protein n=1 Tax=Demequina soli TaxID=1638987 RepID=UPI0009E2B3A8|nr:discoidin domain-containing protein [Demequina soli]
MSSRRIISSTLACTLACTLAAGGLVAGAGAAAPAVAAETGTPVTITPNPAYQGDAFEGWGTSLVWFANATGGYPDAVRDELVDKVFGQDGLALNIARYNIGGGNATDVPAYLRPGGAVEGWWNPDLGASDAQGPITSTYADRARYAAAWDPDDPAAYNLDADQSQRWWVNAIKDKVTRWEAFSNSPPYFLTQSGFVSGGIGNGSTEQLAAADMDAFAGYLVNVVERLEADTGISFDTLDPFNEPNTSYWSTTLGANGWPTTASRQEGAHIGASAQDAMIKALRDRLARPDTTTDVGIAAMDETNPSIFATNWNTWSVESKAAVTQLNVHTYGTSGRLVARDIAKASDKPLSMSEVGGDWDGTGFNTVNIDNGLGLASHMVDDLRELEPSDWTFWQPVEDLYNMQKVENLNWGSVFVDFDCNADGDSVRRLADGDADPSCRILTNSTYNTARNFTHYIHPGDHLVPTDDAATTAAIPADGDGVTLVHVNDGTDAEDVTLDLSGFGAIAAGATVTPIVTTESTVADPTANALVEGAPVAVDAASRSAVVHVPAKSVTTFVVSGVSGVAADAPAFRDGDTVQLAGVQSSKPLTATGDALTITKGVTSKVAAQSWTVHTMSGEGTNRQRIALESGDGRLLGTVAGSAALVDAAVADAAADTSLQWIPSTTDGSTFSLLSVDGERVLDVNGQSSADGTAVGLWTSNGGGNQTWTLAAPGAGAVDDSGDGVPRTDDPPTYVRYSALADPGKSADDYFQPFWYDTDGRHIQAHGGQIVAVSADELGVDASDVVTGSEDGRTVYYWYGEDRTNGYWNSPGVAVYRSTDTMNWTYEGRALRSVASKGELTQPYFASLYGTVDASGTPDTAKIDDLNYYLNTQQAADYTSIFERPKVLYNAQTKKWVMWWHSDGRVTPGGSTYARSLAGVAVSDSPTGPFKLVGAYRMYNRASYQACTTAAVPGQARDMTVFQADDGTAYIVYSSEENRSLYIAKLDADYTNVEHTTTTDSVGIQYSESGEYPYLFADGTAHAPVRGQDFQIVKECGVLEAPAMFEHGGKFYVVASGATGWDPNPQTYYTSDSILGSWIRGVKADDAYENVAYSAIPEGGDGLLSVGDTRRTTFGSQSTNVLTLGDGHYVYMGDRWDAGESDSTYVWLPMTFGEGGALEMRNPAAEDPTRWGDGWDASYWDDKGDGDGVWTVTDDRLPETIRRGADLDAVLPSTVAVTVGGVTDDAPVTWDTSGLSTVGAHSIVGTLAAGDGFGPGRTFTRTVTVWDYATVNLAPDATVSASSRTSLAGTLVDLAPSAKGWDDWTSSGYPRDSWLSFTWASAQRADEVAVHTYADGGATWPSKVTVQYLNASGAWVTSAVSATVAQDASQAAPVVRLDTSALPATSGIRLQLHTDTNTWQSISEVEILGTPGAVNVCRGATVSASYSQTLYGGMPAANACDGSTGTAWSTWTNTGWQSPVTYTVETATAYDIAGLSFTNTEGNLTGVSVAYKAADGTWKATTAQNVAPAANNVRTDIAFDTVSATGLRLTFTTPGSYLKIPELTIPGTGATNVCRTGGGTVAASFWQTQYETLPATNACDRSTSTVWSTWPADASRPSATFTAYAASAYRVSGVTFTNSEGSPSGVSVAYRGTDGAWRPTSAQGVALAADGTATSVTFAPVVATAVRLVFATPGTFVKIAEIAIPGTLVPAPTAVTVAGDDRIVQGGTLALTATVAPAGADDTLVWTSSDPAIATVSQAGVVTGVAYGDVVVTASVTGAGVSAQRVIHVLPPAWSATTKYKAGDLVSYGGAAYEAQWGSRGEVPGSSATGAWGEAGFAASTPAGDAAAWTASGVYTAGDRVVYQGKLWQAQWWTRNEAPGQAWGPWMELGAPVETSLGSVREWTASMVYTRGGLAVAGGHVWRAAYWLRGVQPAAGVAGWADLGEVAAG